MNYLIPLTARRDLHGLELEAGSWGGAEAVCMMSGLVAGAKSTTDCVTAGWPEWLSDLNISLFDADVGAADEHAARLKFALDVASLVSAPRDYDRARDLFLIRRLDEGDYSAIKTLRALPGDWPEQIFAVEAVVALLRRRIAGEDVAKEMSAATRAAAYAAEACAAARAARATAYAAEACAAARAAARADLIIALNAA